MPDCAWLPALFVSVKVSFFFSSRRRHTRSLRDWSSDVCSSDLEVGTPGDLARTIVALQGAGANPRSFGGQDLVSKLLDRRAANGSFAGWPGTTAFSAIALRTAGAGLDGTLSWLAGVQNQDGGWGDVPGQPSNVDVTGAAMQAMPSTKAAEAGLSYLRKHQHSGGGFALGNTGEVNSQSTA